MTAPLAAPAGDQSGTRAEFARSDTAGATASPEVFPATAAHKVTSGA